MDLKDAYFHVELHKGVRHVTTFTTANEVPEIALWALVCFRAVSAGNGEDPDKLQVHHRIFLLVFATFLEELRKNVDEVKSVLESQNLAINEEKSCYNQKTVEFVGFTLDGGGILPTQKKILDIMLFEKPKAASKARSFPT